MPEPDCIAVLFVLVVVETIIGVGVGGGVRVGGQGVGWEEEYGGGEAARVMVRASTADSEALHNKA